MSYINSSTGFNGATGSMGRYSYMGTHDASLYGPLFHKIDKDSGLGTHDASLYGPLYHKIDIVSRAPESMAAQAKAVGYQDVYKNIQAMREAEFKKEVKGKEIIAEFSGLRRPGGLGGGFWFS